MLKKLIVERFKSIRAATIELGRINLFIGGNGAGKSNVLEATGVLSASIYRGLRDTDLGLKGVRITPPALMKSAFKSNSLPRTLQLTGELDEGVEYGINLTGKEDDPLLSFVRERCLLGKRKMFGRGPNGAQAMGQSIRRSLNAHRGLWDQVGTAFDFPEVVESSLRRLSQYAIYAPQCQEFKTAQGRNLVVVRSAGAGGSGRADVRLNNASQLSGFAKRDDLALLPDKEIVAFRDTTSSL